ncbi:hypothetical protein M422DRAFT_44586 [Sphaerobolus stellatus SS14]|nr:hypothetical protein M422DRAFT_44586 [Sphaerobolus stellatus SS14]
MYQCIRTPWPHHASNIISSSVIDHFKNFFFYAPVSSDIDTFSICHESGHNWVAITSGLTIWVGEFDAQDHLNKIWEQHISEGLTASGVHFIGGGNTVLLAIIESHMIIKYQAVDGAEYGRGALRSRISSSDVSPDGWHLVLEIYDATTLQCLREVDLGAKIHVPIQVRFLGESGIIGSGSDCGLVWMCDMNSEMKKKLKHTRFRILFLSEPELVQTVQYHGGQGSRCMATASSRNGQCVTIKIWNIEMDPQQILDWKHLFIIDTQVIQRFLVLVSVFILILVIAILSFLCVVQLKAGYHYVYSPGPFVIEGDL